MARTLPTGFEFIDSKVKDKDITSAYEPQANMTLTISRQDEFLYKVREVRGVVLMTTTGALGVQPGHEYKIAQLPPGVITVEQADGTFTKLFTSGGFAHINNDGSCDINTAETIPVDDLDLPAAERELAQANSALGSSKGDKDRAIAEVRVFVAEKVVACLKGE